MAKASAMSGLNPNDVRRAQKAKQKAAVRKGGKVATGETFSFAAVRADKKAKRDAELFGKRVDIAIHSVLDAADKAGNNGVELVGTSAVIVQAKIELTAWTQWHGGYATTVAAGIFRIVRLDKAAPPKLS